MEILVCTAGRRKIMTQKVSQFPQFISLPTRRNNGDITEVCSANCSALMKGNVNRQKLQKLLFLLRRYVPSIFMHYKHSWMIRVSVMHLQHQIRWLIHSRAVSCTEHYKGIWTLMNMYTVKHIPTCGKWSNILTRASGNLCESDTKANDVREIRQGN